MISGLESEETFDEAPKSGPYSLSSVRSIGRSEQRRPSRVAFVGTSNEALTRNFALTQPNIEPFALLPRRSPSSGVNKDLYNRPLRPSSYDISRNYGPPAVHMNYLPAP
jgi:hypothetical protein